MTGLEQHLWVLDGTVEVTDGEQVHHLDPGDCVRMRVFGPTRFRCAGPVQARYVPAVVRP